MARMRMTPAMASRLMKCDAYRKRPARVLLQKTQDTPGDISNGAAD